MLPLIECELVLVYAMQTESHIEKVTATSEYGPDYFYTEMEKKAKKHLGDLVKELKSLCLSVEVVFERGLPAKVIESVAKEQKADLTVIRGSASGLLESVFLGNTVSQVIKHSHSSVFVLRAGAIETALKKVIIALDGSEQSKEALRRFCRLYQTMKQNIEVVLTHVVSIPGPWRFISPIEFVATLEDNLDMAGKAILAEGEAILLEGGWKPEKMPAPMIVRTGDPAVELDRLAGEIGADLIVLGAQGKTAFQSFFLGGVSEALALKSGFPILVFK